MGKGQAHYIEVLSRGESDDSNLEIGADIGGPRSPRVASMLGSMIASLHGVKKYLTLKVIGQARGQDVMVLIDPGASHNFIDVGFVEKKGMRTEAFQGFRVSNANGELTLVDHIVERFGVRLQSCVVQEDFYLYPLKGHPYTILGVQWLFDLGDIHTNYQKLTMSFEIDGKTHTLQGIKNDFPQVDSKRLEVIEWCKEKEEAEKGITQHSEELRGVTKSHEGAEFPTLCTLEACLPTLDTWKTPIATRGRRGVGDPTLAMLET